MKIVKYHQPILVLLLLVFIMNGGLIYIFSSTIYPPSLNALALENDTSSVINKQANGNQQIVESIGLGKPIYKETYFVSQNGSDFFEGNGTIYDIDVVVATGNATFVSKSNNTVLIEGSAQLASKDSPLADVAPYIFHSLGYDRADGSFVYGGIAFFEPNATGKLSMLSNTIGIYKGETMADGHGTFKMWKFE